VTLKIPLSLPLHSGFVVWTWLSMLFFGICSTAQADILHGIGVMGDSGSISSSSYKWPVQLQTNRGLNFGGSGLPYDHAVGGATSTSLLSGHQNTQMAADVTAGKVTLGIIFIGNNDWGSTTGLAIAQGTATPSQQTSFQNTIVSNIQTAVNTELTAGIQGMLIGSVEDITLTPTGQSLGDPDAIARVQASISAVNSQVLSYAQAHHLPYVNFYGLGDDIYASGHLTIGGVNINLTGSGSDAHNFWIDDLHPGIVGNAILGNMWMEAMNIAYGTHLALYTDKQILTLAGLGSSYTGETFSTAYNLANYVSYAAAPEPSTVFLAVSGFAALGFYRMRSGRDRRSRRSD
jgi:hypothetical protein